MNKEEVSFYEEWEKICEEVSTNSIKPLELVRLLLSWAHLFKNSRQSNYVQAYDEYFAYYDSIDYEEFDFYDRWYSLDNLIQYDILQSKNRRLQNLILECRNVLHEILIFKTDIHCPRCKQDDLRALTNDKRAVIYLSCDLCNYLGYLNGSLVEDLNIKMLPINPSEQVKYKLLPSNSSQV